MTNDDEMAQDDLPRELLDEWTVPEMPTDMKERVMAQVHEQWNMGVPTHAYGAPPKKNVATIVAMLAASVALVASGTAAFFAMRPQPAPSAPASAMPVVVAAEPAAKDRTLTVETTPEDARVELDGVSLPGLSPFVTNGVALGSHEIRVRREGHADWIRVVRLGEEDLHLVVALKELPTAAATLESVPGEPSMGYEKTPLGVRPVPHVSQEQAKVKGALDKDIIRRIVRAHTNEIRYCYNQGLVRDPKLSGRAVLKFTIGPDGNVLVAVVKESTISDPDVGTCMVKAVKRWKFPKPDGGGNVVVEYPFVLTSE